VGDVPFYLKFLLKVTHPFEKRPLRPIAAYNVRTVRDSENVQLLRIGSRPRPFKRAIDEVRMLLRQICSRTILPYLTVYYYYYYYYSSELESEAQLHSLHKY